MDEATRSDVPIELPPSNRLAGATRSKRAAYGVLAFALVALVAWFDPVAGALCLAVTAAAIAAVGERRIHRARTSLPAVRSPDGRSTRPDPSNRGGIDGGRWNRP